MSVQGVISLSPRVPAINLLLQFVANNFLYDSYCLTIVTDETLDFNFNLPFTTIIPKDTRDELQDQLLVMSERGCSDYIVNMKDREKFMAAFDAVTKAAIVRRGDKKLIFLPLAGVNNTEKAAELLAMPEVGYVTHVVVVVPSDDETEHGCETFDLVTHRFIGPDEESRRPTVLNRWDSCTNQLQTENPIFAQDLSDLFGRTLRVASFPYGPYNYFDLDTAVAPTGRDGMEFRVVEQFCRWVNCSIEVVRDDAHEWGVVHDNGTGDGVIGSVAEDRADIGVTGLYSIYQIFTHLDLSAPTMRCSVVLLAPAPRLLERWSMPLKPFDRTMWCAVIVTFLVAAVSLFLANRCSSDGIFLTATGLMIAQFQPHAERNWRVRSVTFWLLFSSLVLVSAYGGGLASFLAVPQYEPAIDSMQDLVDRAMEWAATHPAWLQGIIMSDEPLILQLIDLFNYYPKEELRRKSLERKTAFAMERMIAGYYAVPDYLSLEAVEQMRLVSEEVYPGHVVALLRKSSLYREKLDELVGRLQQSGLMVAWANQVAEKYLNLKMQQRIQMSRLNKNAAVIKPLNRKQVVGIFMIFGAGTLLSAMIFVMERVTVAIQRRRQAHRDLA